MTKDVLMLEPKQIEYITSLVEVGGVVPLNVTGTSMRPFLSSTGDTVFLVKCERDEIKKGSIVLFVRGDGSVVLHRVKKIIGDRFQINGDAQNWCEYISFDNIIAKVMEYEHNGRIEKPDSVKQKVLCFFWRLTYKIRPYIFALKSRLWR